MNKPEFIEKFQLRYESLETRQRVLVALVIAVFILLIFNFAWFIPQENNQATLKRELSVVQNKRKELVSTLEQRNQELLGASMTSKREKLKALEKQEAALDEQLSEYAQLVSPRQMPQVLRAFFEKSAKLKLISLSKDPVKPAFQAVSEKQNKNLVSQGVDKIMGGDDSPRQLKFFRHDFTVHLSGSYFELLSSLRDLEKMNLKIYWDSLRYEVDYYPRADIYITVYTYSYDENWIGV
ncbi:MAG: hypothetical protein HWE27_18390 [Gammaproteobacteria bacterium]|nr:hypothetical protein [Gammaproteobacteria bacterium]